jgi:hypothetical protein
MRVLLQNTETKLYFVDTNEWTDDPLKATDFEEVEHAAEAYDTQDVAYAQIVVSSAPSTATPYVLTEMLKQANPVG